MVTVEVELDPRKSVHENAAAYYEESKKFKEKIEGLRAALAETERLLGAAEKAAPRRQKRIIEREWYEKFHWFFTTGGFLALGGKDAKSNQILVRKYMDSHDLYFHADVHGAPSVILKNGQRAAENDLLEAAQFCLSFSSGWKDQMGAADAYCVKPEQVKTAVSGEYVPKGGFVLEGERKWFRNVELKLALSFMKGRAVIAPEGSVPGKKILIKPAPSTKGEAAKKIAKKFAEAFPESKETVDEGEFLRILPNGGSRPY